MNENHVCDMIIVGCILRQSVATGAFASGHLALRVAGS